MPLLDTGPAGIGKSALCNVVRERWQKQPWTESKKVDMFGASTAEGVDAAIFSGLGITGKVRFSRKKRQRLLMRSNNQSR